VLGSFGGYNFAGLGFLGGKLWVRGLLADFAVTAFLGGGGA